ncbi:methylase involved in ubiquinone/menaquinone biosynthesis [Rubidibacter lacunae KORDI 51-2]|uniref:Methylase involved in ubiquinone/menaquinone biosynthesis n=1 Tax=Rubidibacter lacunae KORDI 51-2 TaxID=582515 RepID=U5DQM3_9CHRO|nr:methyltransferase domain-containing protein [Rubidibacter lacunae]ERN42924.1 methylase involved in ubiquinone/menaquinone biosynthesis [Rubidibacter lacunae KORDI 51-2]
MSNDSLQAQIEAATGYEDLPVPALTQQWAERVLDAAQIRSGDRVLDVACGTGVLARSALERVGSSGSVSGIDPGLGMLQVAERLAPTVEWRQGSAESLAYANQSFDAVVSQFGLMFFADRHKALQEMLRVLTPGGRLAVAVWDLLENIPAYATEVALLNRLAGEDTANAVRAPFQLGARSDLEKLFGEAGVSSVAIATHKGTGHFPSVKIMVEADLRGWLPVMGIFLDEEQIQSILVEAETALDRYVTAKGSVEFDVSAHIVTGLRS